MNSSPQKNHSIENNLLSHDENKNITISNDIEKFEKLGKSNLNNSILAYYNINSLRNKIHDLKGIISRTSPDILVIA